MEWKLIICSRTEMCNALCFWRQGQHHYGNRNRTYGVVSPVFQPWGNSQQCLGRRLVVIWYVIQYTPRNMHTVFALLCFVVVIHWLIFPYPSGLLHWHCGNLTIAPVPAKQPWWIWINTSCEFIMNDYITTTKQSTTKPSAYFLGYTVAAEVSYGMQFYNSCCLELETRITENIN